MTLSVHHLDNEQGIVFLCRGILHGQELINALAEMPLSKAFKTLKYALIDETGVESIKITSKDVYDIVKYHRSLAVSLTEDAVVAIIAPSTLGYGLGRMWEALADDIGWVTKVFKTKNEATEWVKVKMGKIHKIDVKFE